MNTITTLCEPEKEGSVPLEQAIAARRSRRRFKKQSLSPEQISQLTWSAQGQDSKTGFRTAPSAGATYPLELFVVSENGLFRYINARHCLEKLLDKDLRSNLASAALGQRFVADAPLTLVFAADFGRTTGRYGKRGIRYVYIEAGHAAQNVHLQAEALGLGSVAVGAFDDDAVSGVLSLPDDLKPLYLVVVGYC